MLFLVYITVYIYSIMVMFEFNQHGSAMQFSTILRHPEQVHPLLWRASQLARPHQRTIPTGYATLDTQLSGRGWPVGALIEIMPSQWFGSGEIDLVKPALAQLDPARSIILLNPPCIPSAFCLRQWFAGNQRIYWIRTQSPGNTLWAAEQVLHHDAAAALLCWVNHARPSALHRLHLAAQRSSALFFCLRPPQQAGHNSVASLRLLVGNSPQGPVVTIIKRRGPISPQPIGLHGSLDRHPSSQPASQAVLELAHSN